MNRRSVVTLAAFLALAINGLTFTFMGTSLVAVQNYFGISMGKTGTLMAVLQAGFTLFSLFGGILSDYCRRERVLMAGTLLLGFASILFGSNTSYIYNLIVVWFMGSGLGLVLSGSNSLLVALYPAKKGKILNIHHVFFGLGSFLGPALMGYLLAKGTSWRIGYISEALVLFLLSSLFFLTGGEKPDSEGGMFRNGQLYNLFKDKHFRIILVVNTLAVGAQVTVLLFGVTFLVQAKNINLAAAGMALSIFSVCMMIGRLICSKLTTSFNHTKIILVLLWLQVISLLAAWYAEAWYATAALAFSGFTFSGIYPTSLALSSHFFPKIEGSALGILTTASGGGAIFLCWLTGYVAELMGMKSGFAVIALASFAAMIIFQLLYGTLRSRENSMTSLTVK